MSSILSFALPRPSAVAKWLCLAVLVMPLAARAQWLTQTVGLNSGWNAVYLHVDASYGTLDQLVGSDPANPILEVWLWKPNSSTLQFVQSPAQPVGGGNQWATWIRNSPSASTLQRLVGNSAYLVRVGTNVATYSWSIKGKPVAPAYQWTTTGLNLLGFPTLASAPPNFTTFLSQSPPLQQNAEIYQYVGGDLGSNNPARVFAPRNVLVNRGQAFWIRAGTLYNQYFAPFEVVLDGSQGANFGEDLNVRSFRLRNLTANSLTVTMRLMPSEAAPSGQAAIVALPPLVIRGALNMTNLTYRYTNFAVNAPFTCTLAAQGAPGADIEVVLGLNRGAMGQNVGDTLAGVLRLTDSLAIGQVDLPVSATVASSAGLWVGSAAVSQVGQYLLTGNGGNTATNLDAASSSFPLRLIVFNPAGSGPATLLQRAYIGWDASSNSIVSTSEALLNQTLIGQSRRVSSSTLPWTTANTSWALSGSLNGSSSLSTTVNLDYTDQPSNPFLHTYHPDHDNLDDSFGNQLAQGQESYTIQRQITLNVTPPGTTPESFVAGVPSIAGEYLETVKVLGLARAGGTNDTRQFQIRGSFVLKRIVAISSLSMP